MPDRAATGHGTALQSQNEAAHYNDTDVWNRGVDRGEVPTGWSSNRSRQQTMNLWNLSLERGVGRTALCKLSVLIGGSCPWQSNTRSGQRYTAD